MYTLSQAISPKLIKLGSKPHCLFVCLVQRVCVVMQLAGFNSREKVNCPMQLRLGGDCPLFSCRGKWWSVQKPEVARSMATD